MAKYHLNGEEFKSKKDILSRCKSIKASAFHGAPIQGDDLAFLLDLFSRHSHIEEKTGSGIDFLTVDTTIWGNSSFYIVRTDGTTIDIGFNRLVAGCTFRPYMPAYQQRIK